MKLTFALLAALVCVAAPALAVPVTVVVVGPDKKPLPAATLDVFDRANEKEPAASREIVGNGGRFSFNWNGKFAAPTAPPDAATSLENIVLVRAKAPGLATKITFVDKNAAVIELSAPRVWGGVVLDQKQSPIAGATIKPAWSFVPEWETQAQAITDANGRWQMDDVPAADSLAVTLSAPNYIAASYSLNSADESAPPLFLKLGATIKGQIVAPDGKPIENAPVIAGHDYQNIARTHKDGRFELSGVAAGEISLSSRDPFNRDDNDKKPGDVGYLISDFEKVRAVAGETTDIGQWKADKGVVITLRAVDDATGKPLKDATFSDSDGSATSAPADAQGRIRARLPAGNGDGWPFLGNVSSENYIDAPVPRRALKAGAGPLDFGTLKLKRGTRLEGTVRVQGASAQSKEALPMLELSKDGKTEYVRFWGDTDKFKTGALLAGNYKIKAVSWNGSADKDWQVVAPTTLAVPAPDANNPALEIVIKRAKAMAAPATLRAVRGQILDEDGQGVGGAVVNLRLKAGAMFSDASAVTGNDGKWNYAVINMMFAANKVEVQSIERPGYLGVGAATASVADGVAVVGGLTMKRSGAIFAGRVVDNNGKSAAGAWVAVLELENYPPVQAGANGEFQLVDVPLDKFTLIAANNDGFARQNAAIKTKNLEIKLKSNAPFDRETVINDALAGDFEWWRISDLWDYIGSERMGELAKRGGDWSRARYALELSEREPKTFGARQSELTQGLDDEQKAEIEAAWNWARAQSPDEAEKFALNDWVDAQKAVKRAIDAENVLQLLRVAAVAHRLGRDDADDLSDYAAAIAAQLKVDGSTAEKWGKPLAKSGFAAAQSFVEGMKPVPEFKVWWTAAGPIAEQGDIAGAQKALARMETLAATPDWIELSARQSWNNPTAQIDQVRSQIARALSKTDVAGAQKLAESVEEQSNRTEVSLVVADRAIKANQPDVAQAALRVAMQLEIGNPENYALAASLAQEVSPQLGAELWADALRRGAPTAKREQGRGNFWPSVAMWAFYHARLDKAQSRVLIEREWNWRLPAAVKAGTDKEVDENDVASISALVMAMGAVDPARALAMRLEAAGKIKSLKGKANVGLAAALLMSDADKARFGLDSQLF